MQTAKKTTHQHRANDLTPRQQLVLNFIAGTIEQRGIPPSIREIGDALHISSLRGVTDHLEALQSKGHIHRAPGARGITLTHRSKPSLNSSRQPTSNPANQPTPIPIIGRVPAGQPLLAEEEVEGFIEAPAVEWGEECFALKVKGDSMIEAGILDGDLVIVRPQPDANNGDIVVARIDDEATVKRFFRERTRIRLQPENAALEPIYLSPQEAEVTIVGKVVGVHRRL